MYISRRAACTLGAAALAAPALARNAPIEQWGLYETALRGPAGGNPFVDISLTAVFERGKMHMTVPGFYDGGGIYRIRFMPPAQGHWTYRTKSNAAALDGKTGTIVVGPPSPGNHGPVRVANTFHFSYADGTRHIPIGTTCYAWNHQDDALCEQTLTTLAASPFNKIRMAVFPNADVPNLPLYPFVGTPRNWDLAQPNPAFFRRLEYLVGRLNALGIEADLILFHPYDHGKWGFDVMPREADERYLRYITARLSAFRNVWWSLANEFDLMRAKTDADFDRLFQVVAAGDPYGHLRAIHNCRRIYNNAHPWVTHASIQNGSAVEDDGRAVLYRDVWRKPVVFDEVKYEGTVAKRWGDLSGEELVHRFWEGTIAGTYVGHGECLADDMGKMWLGAGGRLAGTSPRRIAFLKQILAEAPDIEPIDKWQDRHMGGVPGQFYLRYFGQEAPAQWPFVLPRQAVNDGDRFTVEVIDSWAMTVTALPGHFTVKRLDEYSVTDADDRVVPLPGKPWITLRIRRST